MHHYAAAIQQDPISVMIAFDPGHAQIGALQSIADAVGNRARLNLRSSRQNNKRVCDDAFTGDVDLDQIFGFFIERRFADGL